MSIIKRYTFLACLALAILALTSQLAAATPEETDKLIARGGHGDGGGHMGGGGGGHGDWGGGGHGNWGGGGSHGDWDHGGWEGHHGDWNHGGDWNNNWGGGWGGGVIIAPGYGYYNNYSYPYDSSYYNNGYYNNGYYIYPQ